MKKYLQLLTLTGSIGMSLLKLIDVYRSGNIDKYDIKISVKPGKEFNLNIQANENLKRIDKNKEEG